MEIKSPHANERSLQSGFFLEVTEGEWGWLEGRQAGRIERMSFIHQPAICRSVPRADSSLANCFRQLSAIITTFIM